MSSWLHCRRVVAGMLLVATVAALAAVPAQAAVPAWLRELQSQALPAVDDETDAVQLLDEMETTVLAEGGQRVVIRRAYRILRRGGDKHGVAMAGYGTGEKVISMRGWSLPASGKPYEVNLRDAIETALVPGATDALITDRRMKTLTIPAAIPGSLVGYEIEQLQRPVVVGERWIPQDFIPLLRARYLLKLPADWKFQATWTNGPPVQPTLTADGAWQWELRDLKAIKPESNMPDLQTFTPSMQLSLESPQPGRSSFRDWNEMGRWFAALVAASGAPPQLIEQVVASHTASGDAQLDKIRSLARFIQKDVRYVQVALELTGYQPRAAQEVFKTGYGDCKDKANALRLLLQAIGVESHLVLVNTQRGAVRADSAPARIFNHAVLAIRMPADTLASLPSGAPLIQDNRGTLLLFDPTDDLTPFGAAGEPLRYGQLLLVEGESARLVSAPAGSPADNGVDRIITMKLSADGALVGDVVETWRGTWASTERQRIAAANELTDTKRPVAQRLAGAIANYDITTATVNDFVQIEKPVDWRYSFAARGYAKSSGNLLLLRPRVLGDKSSDFLDTGKPRVNDIAFDVTHFDKDTMRIELPQGYVMESLPEPVDVDIGFAAYHSRSRMEGNTLVYERSFEQKEFDLPLARVNDLKALYSAIDRDERAMAVLRRK